MEERDIQRASNLSKLPEMAYVFAPDGTAGKVIKGMKGYYPMNATKSHIDYLNKELGVDEATAGAMLVGSMFGWHVPGADPDMYRK